MALAGLLLVLLAAGYHAAPPSPSARTKTTTEQADSTDRLTTQLVMHSLSISYKLKLYYLIGTYPKDFERENREGHWEMIIMMILMSILMRIHICTLAI